MPMAKNLVELRDVYKIYGEGRESEVRALDGVSLTIGKGEFVAVVGQSGSGKSTMMNVLAPPPDRAGENAPGGTPGGRPGRRR